MNINRSIITVIISIIFVGCLFGQTELQNKNIEMYTTLLDNSQGYPNCELEEKGTSFIFKVISSTDTTISPGSTIAIAIICTQNITDELSVGKSYSLNLSNKLIYNGSKVTDLLKDGGEFIHQYNKSDKIYWVLDLNEIRPDFIRRAELKLGIEDFPMKKLNLKTSLSSNYSAFSDDSDREGEKSVLISVENYPFPINKEAYLTEGEIGLFVDTTIQDYYDSKYQGYRVFLFNNRNKTAIFPSNDNRIHLIAQAQDQDGVWRDIEVYTFSDCAHSYYDVILKPEYQWSFVAPLPSGKNPTKIRMSLHYTEGDLKKMIYSNEYVGDINWEQLIIEE